MYVRCKQRQKHEESFSSTTYCSMRGGGASIAVQHSTYIHIVPCAPLLSIRALAFTERGAQPRRCAGRCCKFPPLAPPGRPPLINGSGGRPTYLGGSLAPCPTLNQRFWLAQRRRDIYYIRYFWRLQRQYFRCTAGVGVAAPAPPPPLLPSLEMLSAPP